MKWKMRAQMNAGSGAGAACLDSEAERIFARPDELRQRYGRAAAEARASAALLRRVAADDALPPSPTAPSRSKGPLPGPHFDGDEGEEEFKTALAALTDDRSTEISEVTHTIHNVLGKLAATQEGWRSTLRHPQVRDTAAEVLPLGMLPYEAAAGLSRHRMLYGEQMGPVSNEYRHLMSQGDMQPPEATTAGALLMDSAALMRRA